MNSIEFIKNMEKNMFVIKNKLLENVNLRKLLFYSTPDALDLEAPEVSSVSKNIDLTSILDYGQDPNNQINSFIAVDLDIAEFEDKAIETINISLFCRHSTILMNNNRLRHFALSQEIATALNKTMLFGVGKMQLVGMELKVLNRNYVGFELEFFAIDSTEITKF